MVLVLINAYPKPWTTLFYPTRCFAAVSLDQASNIADTFAFGNNPRLSENPRAQLRNCERPFRKSLLFSSNTPAAPDPPARSKIGIQKPSPGTGSQGATICVTGRYDFVKDGIVLESSR
jgi:hypothetical protein